MAKVCKSLAVLALAGAGMLLVGAARSTPRQFNQALAIGWLVPTEGVCIRCTVLRLRHNCPGHLRVFSPATEHAQCDIGCDAIASTPDGSGTGCSTHTAGPGIRQAGLPDQNGCTGLNGAKGRGPESPRRRRERVFPGQLERSRCGVR